MDAAGSSGSDARAKRLTSGLDRLHTQQVDLHHVSEQGKPPSVDNLVPVPPARRPERQPHKSVGFGTRTRGVAAQQIAVPAVFIDAASRGEISSNWLKPSKAKATLAPGELKVRQAEAKARQATITKKIQTRVTSATGKRRAQQASDLSALLDPQPPKPVNDAGEVTTTAHSYRPYLNEGLNPAGTRCVAARLLRPCSPSAWRAGQPHRTPRHWLAGSAVHWPAVARLPASYARSEARVSPPNPSPHSPHSRLCTAAALLNS